MDIRYMKRAIELAKKAEGYTSPNPLVGAVIVKNGRIIGEGYHQFYGGNHAEINAFENAIEDVKGAEMYVTLEPCSHYGKTPPCADAIVKHGIKKVILGLKDPNPLVSGQGIQILEENGIEVISGVLEEKIKKLNEVFLKYITTKRPFCILKTAMTLDGKIATYTGDSKWVSGEEAREYVHQLRHTTSAIMVGIHTVLADDPLLTTRLQHQQGKDPIKIVVDSQGRIPLEAKVLNTNSKAKTIIATTELIKKEKLEAIKEKGGEVIITPTKNNRVDLVHLMEQLGERKIDSVLLEGGGTLNYSALKDNLIDKVIAFIAPKIIGGKEARTSVEGRGISMMKDALQLHETKVSQLGNDVMIEAYLRKEE